MNPNHRVLSRHEFLTAKALNRSLKKANKFMRHFVLPLLLKFYLFFEWYKQCLLYKPPEIRVAPCGACIVRDWNEKIDWKWKLHRKFYHSLFSVVNHLIIVTQSVTNLFWYDICFQKNSNCIAKSPNILHLIKLQINWLHLTILL